MLERKGVRSGHVVVANFTAIARAVAKAQNQADHPIVVLPAGANELGSDQLAVFADQILQEIFGLVPGTTVPR